MSIVHSLFLLSHLKAFTLKCSIYDSPCLSSWTQNYASTAIPGGTGFGFAPLDPMYLAAYHMEQDGIQFRVTEVEVLGAKHALVDKILFNKKNKKALVKIRIPSLTLFGDYTSTGEIFKVPFNGEGKLIFNLYDAEYDMTISYEKIKGNDGKDYLRYDNYTYWYDVRYIEAYHEDINKDDPKQAEEAQHIWSKESKRLWQQYGRTFSDLFTKKVFETLKKFLLFQPAENFLFDY